MRRYWSIALLCLILPFCLGAQFTPLQSKIYRNATYAASGVATTQTGVVVLSVTGFNNLDEGQFIMVFDSATVPADTAVPDLIPLFVPAGQNFSYDAITRGHKFVNGISWSNSSTGETKTIGSADVLIQIEYK